MQNTEGKRIYAIGDIHGCLDELNMMQARIRTDLERRPHADPVVIYIGDFTDRGPDSRGVIDNLIATRSGLLKSHHMFGNHDRLFLRYLEDPDRLATQTRHWLDPRLGGDATLISYGISDADPDRPGETHSRFARAVPDAHKDFLKSLELMLRIGSYVFAHAGIRPGVPLDQQEEEDLVWIRDPFLSSTADHGVTVVHGHTNVPNVENRGNRIAIDTGAVFGRYLSCVVLEGIEQHILEDDGPVPCPVEFLAD